MLGTVLGNCMSSLEGLNAAYLPQGVDESIARSIVAQATVKRSDVETYSILVAPNGQSDGISSNAALKYRQGHRLAVVVGRHPDLGSFTQSFQEILGPNYPEGAHQELSMEALSRAAMLEVLKYAGVSPESPDNVDSWSKYLHCCLQQIADVQKELRQGTESWNVYWFMQVDAGLKRLGDLLKLKKTELPSTNEFFKNYTFASFGLPYPTGKNGTRFKPRDFVWAFQEHWSDSATIASTVKYLEHHPDTKTIGPHVLDSVTWTKFDQVLAFTGNHGIAFAQYAEADDEFVEGLRNLPDRQFVAPIENEATRSRLVPEDSRGRSLSVEAEDFGKGPFVALSTINEWESTQESEVLRIKIPTLRAVDELELQSSAIALRAKTAKANWNGELQIDEHGGLWAIGTIYRHLGKTPWKAEPKLVKLNILLTKEDPLFGVINSQSSVDVHIVSSEQCGLWAVPVRTGGSLGRPRYWGEDELTLGDSSAPDQLHTVELDSSTARYRYIVWASGLEEPPILGGQAFDALNQRAGIYVADERLTDFRVVQVGESRFECRSPDSSKASHSPIVGAITRMRPASEPLDAESLGSLRGIYESFLIRSMKDASWQRALGHLVTAEDREYPLVPSVGDSVNGLLMSGELARMWPTVSDFSVPEDLLDSEAAMEFRQAFSELELPETLKSGVTDTGEPTYDLPSKSSWRWLWTENPEKLERYLNAYADLIVAARHIGNPAGIFWATYPMSTSVWETKTASKCKAVLLSPLHPVRLAWLAGVESTLWESNLAEKLAGTVEGWNFPLIGPRETEGGRLIAVPLESGQDQVFLGWSILVRASIDGHASLLSPEKAGDRAVPGTAVSGLNATAVSAALRSYRKINPQVSTMTIDLAAHSETNRLTEVDEAILTEVGKWNKTPEQALVGGVRVWDSTKRAGDPPQEKMTRLIQANAGVPLIWTRYAADAAEMKRCNVRILEDAGVQVEVKTSAVDSRLGTLGRAPLRRFEAVTSAGKFGTTSISSPTFREDQGWEPLAKALRECEGASSTTTISTKLFQANVISGTADWTVSGEALMNPSAMASVVQHTSNGSQMLWEWRPPFLEKSSEVPALERRPFVSVARVPFGFREQIKQLLSKARGKDVVDEDVDTLLGKLGARGVGLSSMLSMGGTHASGALGFFLVFALMDQLQTEMDNTFVLPIDACDSFLRALADGSEHTESTRRADVLILRVEDGAVTLAPIEIKFYGLGSDSPQGSLPSGKDSAMQEPLEQAYATQSLLERIGRTWDDMRNSGSDADRALWANGLAALVEAAIRLQPVSSREPEALAKSLSQVVQGSSEIRIGRSLIAFFKHDALTVEGNTHQISYNVPDREVQGEPAFALLSANSASAFAALEEDENSLMADWEAMVRWSMANAKPVQAGADTVKPEPSDKAEILGSTTLDEAGISPSIPKKRSGESSAAQEVTGPSGSSPASDVESPRRRSATAASRDAVDPDSLEPTVYDVTTEDLEANEEAPVSAASPEFVGGIRGNGVRFPVGQILGSSASVEADFWPSNTDLNQMNVGIVGDLGTGKTQLMKALVYQLRKEAHEKQESPLSMLIFDYKRDFQEPEFLEAVGGEVLRINNIPLNFFQLREGYTPMAANQRANEFIDVLDKIYGGIGPVQKDRLSLTITDLYRENKSSPPTLGRILSRYSEDVKPDAVTSILRKFVSSEVFTEDAEAFQSFADIIDNKVLVVALNDFGTDDDGKNSLVVMFLNLYYDYMLNSPKWPFVGESPQLRRLNSYLLVDEAVNIIKYKFPVLMNLLLQGREFGFGVMLASQYLSHFKKDQENYGEPLLTWFIHKVKSASPKDLQQLGLGEHAPALVQRILNLSKHQALYSSLGHNGRFIEDMPFFRLLQEDNGDRPTP